jgi:sirohydrochlorin cobaltochelatase
MPDRATVFFCHGSRNPGWREPFERLLQEFRQAYPGRAARLAFLELMAPTLPEVLLELSDAGYDAIEIYPLFLAGGAHTGSDLPALVSEAIRQRPGLHVTVSAPLLESARIRAALVAVLSEGAIEGAIGGRVSPGN